ncbi:MAG: hypothetical protein Ct9H300mP6_16910 [Gammaproteobacteria bacterium]|nr:MAG: hypothetical protein Ct9H300mP6_16910 [Gammaproteobacteria bacterium]
MERYKMSRVARKTYEKDRKVSGKGKNRAYLVP